MERKKQIIIVFLAIFLVTGCKNKTIPPSSTSFDINPSKSDISAVEAEIKPTSTAIFDNNIDLEAIIETPSSTDKVEELKEVEKTILKSLDYEVDFVSQAPFAVWDDLHGEACEEASMIMVDSFFREISLTPHIMEQGILNNIKWQEKNGYKIDLSASETVEILKEYFDLDSEVISDVSVDRIKKELSKGNLIIVPAAGRLLGNPYFQTPGPIYHMLVIRGYTQNEFITNDPGTKRGEGFKYKFDKLIYAIHDWDHNLAVDGMDDDEIVMGRKVIISVKNPN